MQYVDGFLAAVPNDKKQEYIEHASMTAEVFREYGAIRLVENWGQDVPQGEVTSMPMAVQCKADETVVMSWIVWPSKEARDVGLEAALKDPRLDPKENPMPFDGKRLIHGGFETVVDV